jgi:hypothetical protein
MPSETCGADDPEAGVAAGAGVGPAALGMAKGVDCGNGVALEEGVIDGVFEGEGDCVDGVVGRVEVGGGVCARTNPATQESAASADSRRTPAFDAFPIDSFETHEYTDVYLNGGLKSH